MCQTGVGMATSAGCISGLCPQLLVTPAGFMLLDDFCWNKPEQELWCGSAVFSPNLKVIPDIPHKAVRPPVVISTNTAATCRSELQATRHTCDKLYEEIQRTVDS